jgi:hypothetical protein
MTVILDAIDDGVAVAVVVSLDACISTHHLRTCGMLVC